jgi:hypothetical protein
VTPVQSAPGPFLQAAPDTTHWPQGPAVLCCNALCCGSDMQLVVVFNAMVPWHAGVSCRRAESSEVVLAQLMVC